MAENNINIGGRLHSIATGNVLAGANEIIDDIQNKKQEEINSELISAISSGGSIDTKITSAVNTEKERAEAIESTKVNTIDMNTALLQKANVATTINGYGITDAYTKTEVNNLITTPDVEYVTVATISELPATGETDTIYRVSAYDGVQVDQSKYALYAWNGA